MRGSYATCRYVCGSLVAVTAVTLTLPMIATADTSSTNFDMRRQVVNLTGILNISDYTGQVTRGDFARMLVNASSYRENLPTSSASVLVDVPSTHPDAIYIRIVASQGRMTGFLGGLLKPEEYITYKNAVKTALTMLDYSGRDSTGDLASSRTPKFNYLELNEKMNRQPEEVLNQTDCMNIFHSLLETKREDSNEIYRAVLDCELNSDGETNPIIILDDERKGPTLMCKGFSIIQSMPLGSENINVFLSGAASILETVKASQQDAGSVVVYHNVRSKTIWAYTTRGQDDDDLEGNNVYVLLKNEVRSTYYKFTDVMTPTSVRLEIDDDNSDGDFEEDGTDEGGYLTISLSSSELQCLFSIYGGIEVGDEVVMVCNKDGSSCTAVDAVRY